MSNYFHQLINVVIADLLLFLRQNRVSMADNYLEKKMEEHRRNASQKTSARIVSTVGGRPGSVTMKIEPLRIYVTDGTSATGEAIVRRLREAACRVAFSCGDDSLGRKLAQSSGSRHYPASFNASVEEDIKRVWGGLDAVVSMGEPVVPVPVAGKIIVIGHKARAHNYNDPRINVIDSANLTPAEIAHLCLILCLADSKCLSGVTLGTLIEVNK